MPDLVQPSTRPPHQVISTEYFDPEIVAKVIDRIRERNTLPYETINLKKEQPVAKYAIAIKNPHATDSITIRTNSHCKGASRNETITLIAGQAICGFFWEIVLDVSSPVGDRDIRLYFTQGPE